MGWFRRPRHDPEEFERLKQQLGYMREQFDKAEGSKTEMHRRIEAIDARDDIGTLTAKLNELRTRLDVWTKSQHALSEQLTALDQRVTTVSTELANQLDELSGDIEQLSASPAGASDPAAIDELVAGQHRLANEQARYQIAFREDLARIADELKRSTR